jgi:Domain of unknown function (DUF4386)
MTITDRAPAPNRSTSVDRVPMTSLRKTALVAGIFYVLTFVSIPTLLLYRPLHEAGYIVGSGPDTSILLGGLLEMIVGLTGIGTAITLYPVLKRQNQSLALGLIASRTLEAAAIFVGVASVVTLVSLRRAGAGPDALVTGQALVAFYDSVALVSQAIMAAVNALLLGTLLYKSRLVPRALPLLGFVGAVVLTLSFAGTMFGVIDRVSLLTGLGALPIATWEFSLGVYLIVKGFKPSPVTAGMTPADFQPAGSVTR